LIVLHHLATYGPLCGFAEPLAPGVIAWLHRDARIAVQVFFVVGGFLAAKSLAPVGVLTSTSPLSLLWRRYLKLVIPYLAAVALSIPCAAAARGLMTHDSIPAAPGFMQTIAHVFLLQDILGFDALSAGIWYVAIDFQLFALLLVLLWLARAATGGAACARAAGLAVVAGLALGSLFYFNRDSAWDVWALYFFASYALGVFAFWITGRKSGTPWLWLMAMVVGAAMLIDWRSRIAVALVTALALGLGLRHDFLGRVPRSRLVSWLGKISYSVFLVHFPVCLVINGLFFRFAGPDPVLNAVGMGIAWGASTAVGALFITMSKAGSRAALPCAEAGVWNPLTPASCADVARGNHPGF
jgi:peptidoglycan/LPS O-acetylase OafA/YrhL